MFTYNANVQYTLLTWVFAWWVWCCRGYDCGIFERCHRWRHTSKHRGGWIREIVSLWTSSSTILQSTEYVASLKGLSPKRRTSSCELSEWVCVFDTGSLFIAHCTGYPSVYVRCIDCSAWNYFVWFRFSIKFPDPLRFHPHVQREMGKGLCLRYT